MGNCSRENSLLLRKYQNLNILSFLEKIISLIKKDKNYKFNTSYSFKELMYIIFYRLIQLVRGFKLLFKCKNSHLPVFCGRSVKVEHGYLVTFNSGFIIEDNVYINALSESGIIVGRNVTIARNASLICTGVIAKKGVGISIGNNSAIGAYSFLSGQGGLTIGNDVIMGPGVKIFSENHNYNDPNILIRKQGENRKGITIEDNCWIGAGVIILDGVIIGSGSVIAAGSVVTKSLEKNSIAAGVPATIIKYR